MNLPDAKTFVTIKSQHHIEATVNVVAEIREGFKQVIAAINDNVLQERGWRSGFQVLPRMLTKREAANNKFSHRDIYFERLGLR